MKATIVLAMLAVVSSYPAATAEEAGILFAAPFHEEATSVAAMRLPCTVEAPAAATVSDPASGSFAPLAASVDVSDCSLSGTTHYRDWTLGTVPVLLVGQPGHVVAVFDGEAVAEASGAGDELWATLEVKLGGADLDGTYHRIVSARCSGAGCAAGQHSGTFTVSAKLDALPPVLHAVFRADAGALDATGTATASFTGALQHVALVPLD